MRERLLNIFLLFFLTAISVFAQEKQPSPFKISTLSINSSSSDISPVIFEDQIIFCSDRRFSGLTDRTSFDGRRIFNIYVAVRKDSSSWSSPEELKSERTNLFNNGPLCIAPDGRTVYFTSDIETGKAAKKRSFKNHSGIFIADKSGNNLGNIRPFTYNNPQYDIGQPSVSKDGKYLFFASNMPGGQGGTDLYFCEWINGTWDAPKNLGPEVNSSSSENYPFMHPSGRLYFSSNRPGGKGRLDVYYSALNLGRWEAPVAMPDPINSPYDDFAFTADEGLQTGYFSSNRFRSDDIFSVTSTVIRKASCDTLVENNYCYQLEEENAVKWDTLPFRYEWKLGDGTKAIGPSVIHCYPGPGSYLVQLDVVNLITREVLYNEKTYNLEIKNVEQAYISSADESAAGTRIKFSAAETNLPGWNISRYYWNFDDGTVMTGKEVEKAFLKPGKYNVQLIVNADAEPGGVAREACVCKNIIIGDQSGK
jgi:Tol biopolymer transport system component